MNHPGPFFSIIIPTLNEEKHLPLLLADLAGQSFRDFEIIVVDGQSEDQTVKKAQDFASKFPLKLVTSQIKNVCHQRNLGVASASADLLIFMDADNRLDKFFLQGIRYRYESAHPDLFTTWIKTDVASPGGEAVGRIVNIWLDLQKSGSNPWVLEALLVIKKSAFKKLKGFNEKIALNEGHDLARRALKAGFVYTVFKDPAYIFSLRRLRKQGALKTITTTAQLEFSRLAGIKIGKRRIRSLYPMNGGSFFDRSDSIEILARIAKRLQFKKYKQKFLSVIRSVLFLED